LVKQLDATVVESITTSPSVVAPVPESPPEPVAVKPPELPSAVDSAEAQRVAELQAAKQREAEKERAAEEQAEAAKAAREQATQDRLAREQAAKEQQAKEQQAKEQQAKEQAAKAQAAVAAKQAAKEAADKQRRQAELRASLAAEERGNASQAEQAQYAALIKARVERAWIRPPGARGGLNCEVRVTQVPGGSVTGVSIGACNGDAAVRQSIEAAVYSASPLPVPANAELFDRNLVFNFKPND
jgi:colicin import membrane protein